MLTQPVEPAAEQCEASWHLRFAAGLTGLCFEGRGFGIGDDVLHSGTGARFELEGKFEGLKGLVAPALLGLHDAEKAQGEGMLGGLGSHLNQFRQKLAVSVVHGINLSEGDTELLKR